MSVFLFRLKHSTFDRAQAKDGQPLTLHVKPDPMLDTCCAGDIVIICTEVNKSAPACFSLTRVSRNLPLRFSATIISYTPSRKDAHLLRFPSSLEQYKNLSNNTKVLNKAGEPVPDNVLLSPECEGMEVIIEKPQYSFQLQTQRCNLLQDGELVIESDSEDTQAYRRIDDDQYVMAIQSLTAQKSEKPDFPVPAAEAPSTPPRPSSPPPQQQASAAPQTPKNSQPISSPSPLTPQTPQTPQTPTHQAPHTPQTPQTPQTPKTPKTPPSSQTTPLPPPPPPASSSSHAPKSARTSHTKNVHNVNPKPNGHATPDKRENDSPSGDSRDPKKPKVAQTSPSIVPAEIKPVDLLMHVTSVAGMLKELDAEHSERLSRLEEEVTRLKARLNTAPSTPSQIPVSPQQSPNIPKESPPQANAATAKKRGRPPTKPTEEHNQTLIPDTVPQPPSTPPAPQIQPPPFQQKSQKPTDPLHFSPGEFIAVRVDPSSSVDGYWMARVLPNPKQGLIRVKWFEKYPPLPGWYFMDNKEDMVDPLSIFHRNFELIVKPWKTRGGPFIDIFRPVVDLSAFDIEK